ARGARRAVDVEDAIEPREVERDGAPVAVADVGLDAADDARASAVRDHRRAPGRRPVEHSPSVVLRAREGDQVGRVREVATEGAHDVAERLPVGVGGTVVGRFGEDRAELGRRPEAGRRELDLLQPRRLGDLHLGQGEAGGEEPRDRLLLLGRRSLALPAPPPEPASALRRHASGWVKRMFFLRIPSSTISTPPLRIIHSRRWSRYSRTNWPDAMSCGSISKPPMLAAAASTTAATLGRVRTRSRHAARREPSGGAWPTSAEACTCGTTERSPQPNASPLKNVRDPSCCSSQVWTLAVCSAARPRSRSARPPSARLKTLI